MYPAAFAEMKDRLCQLLDERLNAKGKTLAAKVRSVRHRLPRRVKRQLAFLLEVEPRMENPKLAAKTDAAKVAAAYGVARDYLEEIKPGLYAKRKSSALIAGIAFQVLIVLILLLAVLRWRGFI